MKACFVSSNSGNVTVEVETYDGTAIGELRGLCMHNIMYTFQATVDREIFVLKIFHAFVYTFSYFSSKYDNISQSTVFLVFIIGNFDYALVNATLSFKHEQPVCVDIEIASDGLTEADETFTIVLTNGCAILSSVDFIIYNNSEYS